LEVSEEGKCKNCILNEIGDEYHFFLKCTANHSLRNNLFNTIILNKPDFIEEIPLNSECFIEAKGLVKFSKSVISRSNSLKIFPMKLCQV
jgi:hypothetical protein